jgi:hypothetical protein
VGAAASSSFHAVGDPTGAARPAVGAAPTGTGTVGHRNDTADNHAAADGTALGQRARPAGSRPAATLDARAAAWRRAVARVAGAAGRAAVAL